MPGDNTKVADSGEQADILVVGAGIAGLRAARTLTRAGARVLVLEKSRGFGGRAATKRVHETRIDHGAQYFTARDSRFQTQVAAWLQEGRLQVWTKGFHILTREGLRPPAEGHPRYAFPEGMNTIGKLLAEGLNVRRAAKVVALLRTATGWTVELEDGTRYAAKRILLNVPAPQALELGVHSFSAQTRKHLRRVEFAPCLALMTGYSQDAPEWSGITVEDPTNPLSWLADDTSKRAYDDPTVLVLHANPAFSQKHLETPEAAVPEMLAVAASLGFSDPRWTQLHRWRYAKTTTPYGEPYLKDDSLFFCGDWCGGAKVEAAYVSGLEVAQALLEQDA